MPASGGRSRDPRGGLSLGLTLMQGREVCTPALGWSVDPVPRTLRLQSFLFPVSLGIPAPLFHLRQFSFPPPSPGIPQVRSKSPKALAPHPLSAAAPLSYRDKHVGRSGLPIPPPPPYSALPCCSSTPDPAGIVLQEGAAQRTKSTRGGKARGPLAPGASSPQGYQMASNEKGAAVRNVRPGGTAWAREAAGSRYFQVRRLA